MVNLLRKALIAGGLVGLLGCGDDKCGDSPFYGKWLWNIANCESSFSMEEDCTADGYRDDGTKTPIVFMYDGMHLSGDCPETANCEWDFLEYSSISDSCSESEKLSSFIEKFSTVYFRSGDNCSDNMYILRDEPYSGQVSCREQIW